MLKKLKSSLDDYAKNIVLVFTGTTVMNFFNLFFQLLIAHKLTAADFAAFNSLLALFAIFSSPLVTLQLAVTKYSCDFHAQNQISKLKFFLSDLLKKSLLLAGATFFLFLSLSNYLVNALKIPSLFCAYIVSALIALSWIVPVLAGGIQGLELFHWYSCSTVVSGILKLILGFIFIAFGYNIAGALGALLIATVVGLFIFYYPLRQFIVLGLKKEDINYKEILRYIFPVGATSLCFMALVSFDMVLVKSYFSPQDAGFYSLAQMLGKIFLFLPLAVSIVMFPRISSLNAKNMQTFPTLSRSLRYILILCFSTFIIYNFNLWLGL